MVYLENYFWKGASFIVRYFKLYSTFSSKLAFVLRCVSHKLVEKSTCSGPFSCCSSSLKNRLYSSRGGVVSFISGCSTLSILIDGRFSA